MNDAHAILLDLAKILGAAAALLLVLGRLRLPPILAYVLAGVIVGPSGLGLVSDSHRVDQIAEVGVLLLMLAVGLESSLERLRPIKRLALGGGSLQVVLTIGLTVLVLISLGWTADRAVFLGSILAMSSTAIVTRTLHERGEADSPHGRVALGILIVQDLAVVPLTILLPSIVTKQGSVVAPALAAILKGAVALGVALALARWVVPALFRQIARTRSRELFSIAVLGLGVATAVATEAAGLSLALGAFVAGLSLGGTDYEHEARAIVGPVRDAFAAVFFVSIGMLLSPVFVWRHPGDVFEVVVLVLVGNTLVAIAALLIFRAPLRVAVLAAVALSQIGEFSFLIAKIGRDGGIFLDDDYQMTVAVSIATMVLTPLTLRLGEPLVRFLSRFPILARRAPAGAIPGDAAVALEGHAILCGFGPMGREIADALGRSSIPVVALELNAQTVERARALGTRIFYADATQPEVLEHAGVARAKAVLVTVPDPAGAREIVRHARQANASVFIAARTKYTTVVPELQKLGADEVVVEELEAGLELLARALRRFDVPKAKIEEELASRRAAQKVQRSIPLEPKKLGEITRVLKRVLVEIVEVEASSLLDGATIDAGVRAPSGASVLAVLRGKETLPSPEHSTVLRALDRIVVFGTPGQIEQVGERARSR